MANKAISELPQALNVNNQDLFVLEQSGIAKKLTAETFITEQGIIDALAEALDGHGGIQSVTLQSLSGRIRTYQITFTDETATTFQVLDGTSISSIQKTSTAGLVDTYTVFLNDGSTGGFFQVRNGQDGSATWDQINGKAPAITDTASGGVANFPDAAEDIPATSLVAKIEPVQSGSGDPAPDNIRPITGWTGATVYHYGDNIIDLNTVTYTNGKYINGSGTFSNSTNFKATSYIPIPGNTKLVITGVGSNANTIRTAFYSAKSESSFISATPQADNSFSATTPNGAKYMRVSIRTNATGTFCAYVNKASTVTEISAKIVNIDWTTEAGTVYGGTLDVTTGVLTVTDGYIASYNGETLSSTWISDRDVYASGTTPTTGAEVVYKLDTPQTYQLTPQQFVPLFGTNNVWVDTGDTSVTYTADTKLYIEKLTMPTEDDMVANQAITSGKFFMVGNNLYIATAAIASGAKIIEGTNATRLSLADALNRL